MELDPFVCAPTPSGTGTVHEREAAGGNIWNKEKGINIAWKLGQDGDATEIEGRLHQCSEHRLKDWECCDASNDIILSSKNVEYDEDKMTYKVSEVIDLKPFGLV